MTSTHRQPNNGKECSKRKPLRVRFAEFLLGIELEQVDDEEPTATTTTKQDESEGCSATPATAGSLVVDGTRKSLNVRQYTFDVKRQSAYKMYCNRCYGLLGWVFRWGPYCKRCEIIYMPSGPRTEPHSNLIRHGKFLQWWMKRGTNAPI